MKSIGLDIGTTTVSAVVLDETGKVQDTITVAHHSDILGESYEKLQDAKKIEETSLQIIQLLLERHKNIVSIGVTGQMHGIVYLDRKGHLLSPLYTWQDERGDLPYNDNESWAEHLAGQTGCLLATGYGLVTHYFNQHHGLIPQNAAKLCTIQDYLAMKLAGLQEPKIHATNAASLGLFDERDNRFDVEKLKDVGIDAEILPELSNIPLLGVGPLGMAVYNAIGDNQASFLGAVGDELDSVVLNIGTGGQISIYSESCIDMASSALEKRPFLDGHWLLVGSQLCAGRSYAILERFFRETVQMVTGKNYSVYPAMDCAFETIRDFQDYPQFVPTFQGTRQQPSLRGSISNLSVNNFTPMHFMYGMMRGIAEELYGIYNVYLQAGGNPVGKLVGSGNGLRKNKQLCHIFSEVFKSELVLSEYQEEAAYGAAVYATKEGKISGK